MISQIPSPAPPPIDKVEVVRRQLGEAIRMFFERRDEIAIHTLASAASQVITDVAVKRGFPGFLRNLELIRPEARRMWREALKKAENFFKHADHDHDATLEFNPVQTEYTLFEAAQVLHQVTSKPTPESSAFFIWFLLKYPDVFLDSPQKEAMFGYADSLHLQHHHFHRFRELIDLSAGSMPDLFAPGPAPSA
jgi:hypothetical protein